MDNIHFRVNFCLKSKNPEHLDPHLCNILLLHVHCHVAGRWNINGWISNGQFRPRDQHTILIAVNRKQLVMAIENSIK